MMSGPPPGLHTLTEGRGGEWSGGEGRGGEGRGGEGRGGEGRGGEGRGGEGRGGGIPVLSLPFPEHVKNLSVCLTLRARCTPPSVWNPA